MGVPSTRKIFTARGSLPESRSDSMTVAVGFNPRVEVRDSCRRVSDG